MVGKKMAQAGLIWLLGAGLWMMQPLAIANDFDMQAVQQKFDREDKAQAIRERIQPVGRVRVVERLAQDSTDVIRSQELNNQKKRQDEPKLLSSINLSGENIYARFCSACHVSGAAGAPKLTDKVAWAERMAAADQREGGFLKVVSEGKGAMPPRGTCMNCNDDDLQAAIDYMLEQVG